jgi:DNA-binding NarL/FixJ family response regulator
LNNKTDIRVAIFDDNDDIREGLYHLINFSEGYEIVGAFPNVLNLFADVQNSSPDVILMDIDMPQITGNEAVTIVKKYFPNISILMLTIFEDEERIFEALKNGATGYLLKKTPPIKILEAISEVMEGGSPMTASIARKVVQFFTQKPKTELINYKLTNKEGEALRHLVDGNSYKMIAAEMQTSIDTIRTHIRHIYEKLQVHSMNEAVSKALREGIV